MKKLKYAFFGLLFLISGQLFSQTSYSRSALVTEINAKINANHANKITGDTLNHVLRHMLDSYCNLVSDSCANGYANFANTDLTFTGNRFHNMNGNSLLIFNGGRLHIIMGDTNYVNSATEIILDTTFLEIYQQQNANNFTNIVTGYNIPLAIYRGNGIHQGEIDLDTSGIVSISSLMRLPGSCGIGTFSSGVDTIFTSVISATSIVNISYYKGTISSPGSIYEDTTLRSAGNYFIIKSTSGSDASTYNWVIIEQ